MEVAARDSDPLSQDLAAALYDLTSSARAAVYRLARSAQAGRYELSGTWLDPRYGSTPVRLSLTAASRLERAAKEKTERVEHEALVGEIDGWQWSSSTVRFKPQQGRAFRAVVPEQLAQQVAQLLSQRGRRVGARFAVLTAYSGRDRRASHKGYALETIRVLDGNDASQPE
ncbi:hypothetical protein [Saccharothrix algeriensis]|uniref:Uncharacterized protein n=1 Tax=Saccharothrix algeriensis TaxID=173560 RepID=A0ABS2S6X5_9PSEU|nr:hypothetical protein [Saccharothrix algeriensis]MBM7812000.1 hypothetical protein [Saccharothrix algeriensis]